MSSTSAGRRGFTLPPASLVFLISTGVLTGGLVIYAAARSVADPIDAVHGGAHRVRSDDLDVEVAVDDGGEIGLLQSGFNRMVAGLRERRTLHDLFGRHVGPDVARQALEKGVALGGERREVSVLFVDIVASTGLARAGRPTRSSASSTSSSTQWCAGWAPRAAG